MQLVRPRNEAMCSRLDSRSNPPFRPAAAPLLLKVGFACLELIVLHAMAETREAIEFSVPTGFAR
jgi:hypothetical protein